MSSISELTTYIEGKRPGFEEEMLGADPGEFAEIEKFARHPLRLPIESI